MTMDGGKRLQVEFLAGRRDHFKEGSPDVDTSGLLVMVLIRTLSYLYTTVFGICTGRCFFGIQFNLFSFNFPLINLC